MTIVAILVAMLASNLGQAPSSTPRTGYKAPSLRPMTIDEIRSSIPLCLGDEKRMKMNISPPCLDNGHYTVTGGIIPYTAPYEIAPGQVTLLGSRPETVSLFLDQRGNAYYIDSWDKTLKKIAVYHHLDKPLPNEIAGPKPREQIGNLISSDDYPSQEVRARHEGIVYIRLTVDMTGRPVDCRVIGSSSYPALDATTCKLAVRRARFFPEVGPDGVYRTGFHVARIQWAIPPGN